MLKIHIKMIFKYTKCILKTKIINHFESLILF